jgi:hypothetical protein
MNNTILLLKKFFNYQISKDTINNKNNDDEIKTIEILHNMNDFPKDYVYSTISDILIQAQKLKWIAKSAESSFYKNSSISKEVFKTMERQISYIEKIGLPILNESKIRFPKKYNIQITYIEQALKASKRIFDEFNSQKAEFSSHFIINESRQYA